MEIFPEKGRHSRIFFLPRTRRQISAYDERLFCSDELRRNKEIRGDAVES